VKDYGLFLEVIAKCEGPLY